MSREEASRELIRWIQRLADEHGVSANEASTPPGQHVTLVRVRPTWIAVKTTGRTLDLPPAKLAAWKGIAQIPDVLPNSIDLWVGHLKVFSCEFSDDHSRLRVINFRAGDWASQAHQWAEEMMG